MTKGTLLLLLLVGYLKYTFVGLAIFNGVASLILGIYYDYHYSRDPVLSNREARFRSVWTWCIVLGIICTIAACVIPTTPDLMRLLSYKRML